MCTMTWFKQEQGYQLFFNRDELLTRSQAKLPSIQTQQGVQFIAPTDPDAGGTWISVNQFGVTVCLLNYYQFQQVDTANDWVSRGDIVRKFAEIETISAALARFNQLDLKNYRAFRLFIMTRSAENVLCLWDGQNKAIEGNVTGPKSSSSVNSEFVKTSRKQHFADLGLASSISVEEYLRFHAGHEPDQSAQSVCMHRADANTVSLSHIEVSSTKASFAYTDGPPCITAFEPALSIDLIVSHGMSITPLAATN